MSLERWIAVASASCLGLFAAAAVSFSAAQAGQQRRLPVLVHSFSPTPLFRGVAGEGGAARAAMYVNNRQHGGGAVFGGASFEMAIDVAVLDPKTGNRVADHCVERSFEMATPLDLKKIQLRVTGTGIELRFPDGEIYVAELFQEGDEVEVVILALAVRGDGFNLAGVEKATLVVEPDLDGDGAAEAPYTKDADWQEGIFTS
jgi:hypothetical protein